MARWGVTAPVATARTVTAPVATARTAARRSSRWMGVSAAAAGILLLVGCVSPPSAFDDPRTDRDVLPAALVPYVKGGDVTTSRYAGSSDGWEVYLVRGVRQLGVCLAYTDGTAEKSGSTCSGGTWVRAGLPGGAEFEANLNGFTETASGDEVQLSPWVRQTKPGR